VADDREPVAAGSCPTRDLRIGGRSAMVTTDLRSAAMKKLLLVVVLVALVAFAARKVRAA
jgi:hypothetical protein